MKTDICAVRKRHMREECPFTIAEFDLIGGEGIVPYDVLELSVRCAPNSSKLSAESIS